MICRGGRGLGIDVNSIKNKCFFFFLVYCSLLGVFSTENIREKNGQVLNKPQMRTLLKNSGGTFLQIQTDTYTVTNF